MEKPHAIRFRMKQNMNGHSAHFFVLFAPGRFPMFSDSDHNYPAAWPDYYTIHTITLPTRREWEIERKHFRALAEIEDDNRRRGYASVSR